MHGAVCILKIILPSIILPYYVYTCYYHNPSVYYLEIMQDVLNIFVLVIKVCLGFSTLEFRILIKILVFCIK